MIEFTINTTDEHTDELSTQLSLLGAAAVTWQDAEDQPIYEPKPGQVIIWNRVRLSAIFEDDGMQEPVSQYLNQFQIQFTVRDVPLEDWVRKTQALYVPLQFGERLWICPSWAEPPVPDAVNVLFDPGVAFGTGTHPTTALCLEWLEANIKGGETLIDYGCGSGILAVAALKLGVRQAIGVDYDEQAIIATKMNAQLNQLDDKLTVFLPENFTNQQADILIANIISQPLIELAPRFKTLVKPQGQLVLSGLMEHQIDEVIEAYQPDFIFTKPIVKDGWVRLHAHMV